MEEEESVSNVSDELFDEKKTHAAFKWAASSKFAEIGLGAIVGSRV